MGAHTVLKRKNPLFNVSYLKLNFVNENVK